MARPVIIRNNVNLTGKGNRTLMFAHGFGCDQKMWRFITPSFEKDYRLVLFDYVGSGGSDLGAFNFERYSNLNGYAQDVLDICEELKLTELVFIGHSVSSMIGMLAAIQNPSIFASIIMVGPSPRYVNDTDGYVGGFEQQDLEGLLDTMEKNYIGWAHFLAPVVMKNDDQPELTKELEASFCSTDPVIARKFAEVTFFSDNRKDLANLKVPSLIMQCADDTLAPDVVGEYLNAALPKSTLVKLKATGHCPHMSHPAETIEHIQAYLAANKLN